MIWRYLLLWVGCAQTAQGVYEARADPWSWVSMLFLGSGMAALTAFAHLNASNTEERPEA